MTDQKPQLDFLKARGKGNVVLVDNADMHGDLAALIAACPAVAETPLLLAQAMNHFAQGLAFTVIEDPAAYEADYRAQLETEAPGEAWQHGVYRLRDFGIPDFAEVTAPALSDGTLVFTARDSSTGLAYRVTAPTDGSLPGNDNYKPLALTPVEDPRVPAGGVFEPINTDTNRSTPADAGGDS